MIDPASSEPPGLDPLRTLNRFRLAEAEGRGGAPELLREAAAGLGVPPDGSREEVLEAVDRVLGRPSRRLAVYGSLAPGEVNARVLEGLEGSWRAGVVCGVLHQTGWGADHGFPAMEWDPEAGEVEVRLFTSPDLPEHWERLDAFEGPDYLRSLVPVGVREPEESGRGEVVVANIYLFRPTEIEEELR